MKAITVTTYYESGRIYKIGADVMVVGGICFGVPFKGDVDCFCDENGHTAEPENVDLVNVHFENQLKLTIPAYEFEKLIAYL